MKRTLILLLTLITLITISGCSAKEKINNKLTEKIIEKTTGNDIDINNDTITITGEDEETLTIGSDQWPTTQLAKNIPEFKHGTINGVIESNDTLVITLESVKKEDVQNYWDSIKKDFPQEVYEMNSDDFLSFTGTNNKDITISITYMVGTLSIGVTEVN